MRRRSAGFVAALLLLVATLPAVAQSQSFDFKDPKGVNNISFILDSELEPIMGVASNVSGTVKFDPRKPKGIEGKIVVDARSVHVLNERMKQKLHTSEWLSSQEHPEISFEVKKAKSSRKGEKKGITILELVGELSCRGVTREITVTATATHLPGKLKARFPGKGEGDLLVFRSRFTVKRSDFKLGPPYPTVADEMEIRVAVVGGAEKKKKEGGW